jgi:hypothetical protein
LAPCASPYSSDNKEQNFLGLISEKMIDGLMIWLRRTGITHQATTQQAEVISENSFLNFQGTGGGGLSGYTRQRKGITLKERKQNGMGKQLF